MMKNMKEITKMTSTLKECGLCKHKYPPDLRHFPKTDSSSSKLYNLCYRCSRLKTWFRRAVAKQSLPYSRNLDGLREYIKDYGIEQEKWIPPRKTVGFFED